MILDFSGLIDVKSYNKYLPVNFLLPFPMMPSIPQVLLIFCVSKTELCPFVMAKAFRGYVAKLHERNPWYGMIPKYM